MDKLLALKKSYLSFDEAFEIAVKVLYVIHHIIIYVYIIVLINPFV